MRPSLLLCLLPALAWGEFLKIEMGFGGMECASCGEFIQSKLGKNAGVKSVNVDRTKGVVVLELEAGNKVKIAQVRSLVQQSGFTPKEATVTARVTPRMDAGVSSCEIDPGYTVRCADPETEMRAMVGKRVQVEGTWRVLQDKGGLEVIEVKKAKAVK